MIGRQLNKDDRKMWPNENFLKYFPDAELPVFHYSVAYDTANREPLFYEQYPGSINDVSQLRYAVDKAYSYGYRKLGFILDRGYFSRANLAYMDKNDYSFIITKRMLDKRGLVHYIYSALVKRNITEMSESHRAKSQEPRAKSQEPRAGCKVQGKAISGAERRRYDTV